MKVEEPIITSILDTDLYKLTIGQVVFHDFSEAVVEYEFTNRGGTVFPEGFADELEYQVVSMGDIWMTNEEHQYLSKLPYFRPTYLDWLRSYQYNPYEVSIKQVDGVLSINIKGPWYRVVLWEVPLMALISELYFKLTGQRLCDDWSERIVNKGKKLSEAECKWIDFGTRRRFSKAVQDMVVCVMKNYEGFLGTSNPMLAMKYNVPVNGTMAHEFIMGCSAKYGVKLANRMALEHWSGFYKGKLDTALPDTFTSQVFFREFNLYYASLFSGIRQDSGIPTEWMDNIVLPHFKKLGLDTTKRKIVFSDGLNTDSFIGLSKMYRDRVQVVGGIGTHFTNDVDVKPLNMVIKMKTADFGSGVVNVVKLSDSNGKYTGNHNTVITVKEELGIQ